MPPFAKYQGLGNDFIIVDAAQWPPLDPDTVKALCDRRFGIGADGVLAVHAAAGFDGLMVVHNADGSISEMCGNGLRCVARSMTDDGHLSIDTGAGPMSVHVDDALIEIAMPPATYHGPVDLGSDLGVGHHVNTGNPHCVLFGRWRRTQMAETGPRVQAHSAFPEGVNVSFATIVNGDIDLTVFERGVGFTLACGTGAVATAVAAWHEGLVASPVTINLPGGPLSIAGTAQAPIMRGPAVKVFQGDWQL